MTGDKRTIDHWFSAGSCYTYLSMMRLDAIEETHGVRFALRPFYLVEIMLENNHIPFINEPAKLNYMWRDIERRATRYGLIPKLPPPFPTEHTHFANQVAHVASRANWGRRYIVESFRLWLEEGDPPGEEPNLSNSLAVAGQFVPFVVDQAKSLETHEALLKETDVARRLGIFGSPTFAIGTELFWGDDRLEDALEWVRSGKAMDETPQ